MKRSIQLKQDYEKYLNARQLKISNIQHIDLSNLIYSIRVLTSISLFCRWKINIEGKRGVYTNRYNKHKYLFN